MKKENIKQKIKVEFMKKKSLKLEDVLFFGLIIFSLVFCGLAYGIGKETLKISMPVSTVKFPSKMERDIKKLVTNSPITEMVPYIAEQKKEVASFLVAIAKKESNWGKYSPKKNGKECFNYWGYRGTYNQTASGYSCFDSPEQAVGVVGGRIGELVDQNIDTPQKMIVWKCGASCAGHETYSVNKWIQDVNLYYKKMNE
jgi:hypothetical protein